MLDHPLNAAADASSSEDIQHSAMGIDEPGRLDLGDADVSDGAPHTAQGQYQDRTGSDADGASQSSPFIA